MFCNNIKMGQHTYHIMQKASYNPASWVIFQFFVYKYFFQNQFFQKIVSWIPSDCQTVLIQTRPDKMSGLIWVQTVDKGYHQTTLVGNLKEINDYTGISSQARALNLICVFIYFQTFCMQAMQALVSLCICTGSPEPSLLKNVICTKTLCAGTYGSRTIKTNFWA